MERPLVTAIAQIGVIVADVELAVDRYRDLLGLDEWHFASVPASIKRGSAEEEDSVLARIAWTTIGDIEVELIEPRADTGIYAEFLRTRGPGLHHVMFVTPDYDRFADHMSEQGNAILRSGVLQHTRFQLFDTETDLGLIVEIAEGGSLEPDAPDWRVGLAQPSDCSYAAGPPARGERSPTATDSRFDQIGAPTPRNSP